MEQKLSDLTKKLKAITEDARSSFGQLTGDQLNWKPSEKGWSVGQCLNHLILTNEQFYPEMDKLATGTRKNSFFENYSPFSGMFGRFLIKAVTEGSRPASAPSKKIVPPSDIPADIVEKYCEHKAEMIEKIGKTGDVDWQKTIVTSPFLAVFTYSLGDAYVVLVEHSKRHINQAKRVMQAEGFPL
jgi:hypothetical protein